jgi:hypothetical protein
MSDPLDPRFARLLHHERARPDPSESTKTRVFARVHATLAIPLAATPDAPPPAPSGEGTAAGAGTGTFAGTAFLSLLLAGGAMAFFASRATWDPPVPPVTQTAAMATEAQPAPLPRESAVPSMPSDPPEVEAASPRPGSVRASSSIVYDLAAERRLLEHARADLLRHDADAALVAVGEHARRFPRGVLSEERDALRVEALVAAARYDDARAAGATFRAAHPGSLLTSAVDSALRVNP